MKNYLTGQFTRNYNTMANPYFDQHFVSSPNMYFMPYSIGYPSMYFQQPYLSGIQTMYSQGPYYYTSPNYYVFSNDYTSPAHKTKLKSATAASTFNQNAPHPYEHIHSFTGVTQPNDGHQHRFTSTTDPSPYGVQHTHEYYATTQFEDKHRHLLIGKTGPAIQLPNGGHIHIVEGKTTGYAPHQHFYKTKTTEVK